MAQPAEYKFSARLPVPYADAVERVVAALKAEGFGVLTEIDVQATLKQKLGADFRRYVILGACNPPLAHQALQANADVGLLLPCNVVVYEDGPGSVVAFADPVAMLAIIDDPALRPVATEAREKLLRVARTLRAAAESASRAP